MVEEQNKVAILPVVTTANPAPGSANQEPYPVVRFWYIEHDPKISEYDLRIRLHKLAREMAKTRMESDPLFTYFYGNRFNINDFLVEAHDYPEFSRKMHEAGVRVWRMYALNGKVSAMSGDVNYTKPISMAQLA